MLYQSIRSHALDRLDDPPLSAVADRLTAGVVGTIGFSPLEFGVGQSVVVIQKASLLGDGTGVDATSTVVDVGSAIVARESRLCPPVPPLMVMVMLLSVTLPALSLTARCTT